MPDTVEYSAYDYELKFEIETDSDKFDLSKELVNIEFNLSTFEIVPVVEVELLIETALIPTIIERMWKAYLSIFAKRGTDSKEPQELFVKFELVSPSSTQLFSTRGKPSRRESRHDYTTVHMTLVGAKSSKLLRTYVDGIYDYELLKKDCKLSYVICDLYNKAMADQDIELSFVFHKPTEDRIYEQISVNRTWFLNAITQLHTHYGLYDSFPMMYSDGTTFHLINISNRAKVVVDDKPIYCGMSDSSIRSTYDKIAPSNKDRAVLIHTSMDESMDDIEKYNISQKVYRIYTATRALNTLKTLKYLLPITSKHIVEDETYLFNINEVKIKDLLNIDHLFPAGYNHILKKSHTETNDLYISLNREESLKFSKSFLQHALFNTSYLVVNVASPVRLYDFMPGYTYRFLPTTEHFKDLDGRYYAPSVVYGFKRGQSIAWQLSVTVYLATASILDR